jgi:osmoprotectant transport system ATP-binding protein
MIRIKRLTKKYGGHVAVNSVDLDIHEGAKHVLIGTSGSGKTTLLKMINKLVPKTEGEIYIDEKDIDDWNSVELRRRLGYIIQDVGLFPHYTIEENVALVPTILKWPKKKIKDRVQEVLIMVGLGSHDFTTYPHSLSGGQKQRVGIARALAANPQTILMDEPFGALDPITRAGMQNEFLNLPGIRNKTLIMVTHDMLEASMFGDVITLLDMGEVQQSGSLKELLFTPRNRFVQEFLSQHKDQLEIRAIEVKYLVPYLSDEDVVSGLRIEKDTCLFELPGGEHSVYFEWNGRKYPIHKSQALSIYYKERDSIVRKITSHDS